MKELYRRYRPKTLKGVLGQDSAVAMLQRQLDKGSLPHFLLLTGPSGVGKTTIGRILKEMLGCGDADFLEINCADFKGIDMVRDIRRSANLAPIAGKCRIWLIDEAHKLTNDAQNAFLKLLEDPPAHAYFMLATTDPQKIIKTIHTRATEVKLTAMSRDAVARVVKRVVEREELKLNEAVIDEVVEAADGSARKALVILDQIGGLATEDEQLKAIQVTTLDKDKAFKLAQEIMFGRDGFGPVAKILRELANEDVEGIRYMVLGYARSCMIGKEDKGPNPKIGPRAFKVIDIFSRNMYDSKAAGLAAACWEAMH